MASLVVDCRYFIRIDDTPFGKGPIIGLFLRGPDIRHSDAPQWGQRQRCGHRKQMETATNLKSGSHWMAVKIDDNRSGSVYEDEKEPEQKRIRKEENPIPHKRAKEELEHRRSVRQVHSARLSGAQRRRITISARRMHPGADKPAWKFDKTGRIARKLHEELSDAEHHFD